MISISIVSWLLAGIIGGAMHGYGVRHSVANAGEWVALIGLLRLVLLATLLTAAAILGHLLIAFAGWIVGFSVTLSILFVRMSPNAI